MIKRAEKKDVPMLVSLCGSWARSMGYDPTDKEIQNDIESIMTKGVVFCMLYNEEVIGIMSGVRHYVFWTKETVAEEHWFFVSPKHRKKGVGKILEKSFRAWAAAHNCDSVIITPNRYGNTEPKGVADYLSKQGYELHGYRMKRGVKDVLKSDNTIDNTAAIH